MGIAGMVLGIIALIFGFIPIIGAFIAFPCIAVGLPLAAIGFFRNRKAGQGTGMSIAGMATNIVALVVIILWLVAFGVAVSEISEGTGDGFTSPANLVPQKPGRHREELDSPIRLSVDYGHLPTYGDCWPGRRHNARRQHHEHRAGIQPHWICWNGRCGSRRPGV